MEKDPTIVTEINEISPLLATLQGRNVFSVPDGYFQSLSETIQEAAQTGILREIQGKEKKPLQTIPDGYFESLSNSILQKIRTEQVIAEEDELPRILTQTGEKNVLTTPEGYFDSLPGKILKEINHAARARVIPLHKKPVFRLAVAAVVATLLFIGFFFTKSRQPHNGFAIVNKKTVPLAEARKYNSETAFEKGISSLSDDQIIAYLENNDDMLDNDQLIGNSDFSDMPDPMDYLTDDNVLDNYLKKISASFN